jgi:hypothetical protein
VLITAWGPALDDGVEPTEKLLATPHLDDLQLCTELSGRRLHVPDNEVLQPARSSEHSDARGLRQVDPTVCPAQLEHMGLPLDVSQLAESASE